MSRPKFPECGSCANRDTDPAICDRCDDADHYEAEDEDEGVEYVSLHDLAKLFGQSA